MPIIANINNKGTAPSRFMLIANSNTEYVNYLNTLSVGAGAGGSDHFMSNMSSIDKVAQKYLGGAPIENVMLDIQNDPNLYRWVNAVLCSFIYGFEGENALEVRNIPFERKDPAGNLIPDPQLSYLRIWKNKFYSIVANDNDVNNPPQNDEDHGINILAFGNDYPNMLGCYSKKYFVIPMKELNLSTQPSVNWKTKFNYLCANHDSLGDIGKMFNIRQRVLLKLTAQSIAQIVAVSDPLKLIQAIIDKYITIDGVVTEGVNIPHIAEIGGIKFYKISDIIDLDNLLEDKVSIICEGNGVYYSLYPFTRNIIDSINAHTCEIKNISMQVKNAQNDANSVESVNISFDYNADFHFVAAAGSDLKVPGKLKYTYKVSRDYPADMINGIIGLHTLCMYPNLPVSYEGKCRRFTYFSCDESMIMGRSLAGINSVDLQNGYFMGDIDGSGNRAIILNKNTCQCSTTAIHGGERKLYSQDASVPEHFIEVCSNTGICYGYIMNMRLSSGDVPAMLRNNQQGFDIDFSSPADNGINDFYAFVDFGSSSSCMKFRVGQGNLMNTIVNNKCTLRMLLVDYSKEDYKYIINDPDINNYVNFPSISSIYNSEIGVNDYYIYKNAWMPVEKSIGGYTQAGVSISPSNKTALIQPRGTAEKSPNIIINNMCFIIACNAVSLGCSEVYIVPSLPSTDYINNMTQLWDMAITSVKNVFPELTIHNVLHTNDQQCLYESIAISNGVANINNSTLRINVDIGDGTTDMSAMIVDAMGIKHMCGYSSVEYAGKNLIKKTINDIMQNAPRNVAESYFKGGAGYNTGIFTPYQGVNKSEYDGKVDNLINNFFSGVSIRNKPDVSWENSVIDILGISNMGQGIDQKISANLIMRYVILMPVVKDFVATSIKIAGDKFIPNVTAINISFYGGSAKGIDLLSVIDPRAVGNARMNIEKYFSDEFSPNAVTVQVPPVNGKDTLVDGLNSLGITILNVNSYQLTPPGQVQTIVWDNINPSDPTWFGNPDNVHKDAGKFGFISLDEAGGQPTVAQQTNAAKITSITSYYDNTANPFEEFKEYYNNEIYGKLIDNHDGHPDVLETITKNFVNSASPQMQNAINQELLTGRADNSFYRAANSKIYPEMIKNTIFMFAISELLSNYHKPLRTDHTIQQLSDVPGYEFGG